MTKWWLNPIFLLWTRRQFSTTHEISCHTVELCNVQ